MKGRVLTLCVVVTVLLATATACGPEPTPTDTPVPPTDTPTPTREPLDPSTLVPPSDLESFVFAEEISWEGTAPDGAEASYLSSTIVKYVGDPQAFQITGTSNEPTMRMALAAAGVEGDTMDMYFVEGSMYIPVLGSWMQVSLDVPESMIDLGELPFDPENLTFPQAYTITQWLDVAQYEGPETYNGVDAMHYSFDETAFNLDLLPAGMEVEEASGSLYVTVEGGYLLHMDMTLSGTGLVLSAEAEEPTLSEGTLDYTSDLSSINEPLAIELPEEVVRATSLPEDIPVPPDAAQRMAVDLMGMKSFLLASDGSFEEVAAFFRAEMPENGWSESSATEDADSFIFEYTQDERTVEIEIGADPEQGQTLIYIVPGVADTALEAVDSVAARIVADAFMTALRDADYAAAYDLCDPDLRAEFGSAEDLGAWMHGNGILPLEWTFTSDNVVDSMRQYLGTATFAGDVELGLEVILVQVEGDWRVAGFHVG